MTQREFKAHTQALRFSAPDGREYEAAPSNIGCRACDLSPTLCDLAPQCQGVFRKDKTNYVFKLKKGAPHEPESKTSGSPEPEAS